MESHRWELIQLEPLDVNQEKGGLLSAALFQANCVKSTITTVQPGAGIQLMIKSGGLGVSRTIIATLPDHGNVEVGRFTVKTRD